jgi:hypothetical protein
MSPSASAWPDTSRSQNAAQKRWPGRRKRDVGVGGAPVRQKARLARLAEQVQVVVGRPDIAQRRGRDLGPAERFDAVGLGDLRAAVRVEPGDVERAHL